jgi:hypothetical protein
MLWLVLLFLILSIGFGFWAFATVAWVGLKIIFWICIALLILSLLGSLFRRTPAA